MEELRALLKASIAAKEKGALTPAEKFALIRRKLESEAEPTDSASVLVGIREALMQDYQKLKPPGELGAFDEAVWAKGMMKKINGCEQEVEEMLLEMFSIKNILSKGGSTSKKNKRRSTRMANIKAKILKRMKEWTELRGEINRDEEASEYDTDEVLKGNVPWRRSTIEYCGKTYSEKEVTELVEMFFLVKRLEEEQEKLKKESANLVRVLNQMLSSTTVALAHASSTGVLKDILLKRMTQLNERLKLAVEVEGTLNGTDATHAFGVVDADETRDGSEEESEDDENEDEYDSEDDHEDIHHEDI
jgi:hypothetical protein